jgi:hypothetical protein
MKLVDKINFIHARARLYVCVRAQICQYLVSVRATYNSVYKMNVKHTCSSVCGCTCPHVTWCSGNYCLFTALQFTAWVGMSLILALFRCVRKIAESDW